MNQKETDELIGQMAADAALLQALAVVVIARDPDAKPVLERQVEAAALSQKMTLLSSASRSAFSARLQELRPLWRDAPQD
jgi:hypothetical protein